VQITKQFFLLSNNPIIMPRSKTVPKRRHVEEEAAQREAIQTLLEAPVAAVEAAAAEATRASMKEWPTINTPPPHTTATTATVTAEAEAAAALDAKVPDWVSGLGVATTVPTEHFVALQALHETIKQQARGHWASWSGSPDDPRRRAFGILPGTMGCHPDIQAQLDISMPWKKEEEEKAKSCTTPMNNDPPSQAKSGNENNDDNDDEKSRNHKAIVRLSTLPDGTRDAIEWLCNTFRKKMMLASNVEDVSTTSQSVPAPLMGLQYDHLIAAQPNLHCGRDLLPIHVDHPLKDGFGICIITIGIVKSGTLLLQNYNNTFKATMRVNQGQAYGLSGMARDACAHGIVTDATDEEDTQRESLNLRFGLHDYLTPNQVLPMIPSSNVLKYWELPDDANASTNGKNTSAGIAEASPAAGKRFKKEE